MARLAITLDSGGLSEVKYTQVLGRRTMKGSKMNPIYNYQITTARPLPFGVCPGIGFHAAGLSNERPGLPAWNRAVLLCTEVGYEV